MVDLSGFKITRTIVDVNFERFVPILEKIISAISHADKLVAEDVIFKSNEPYEFDPDEIMTFELLAHYGIGFFDYLLCCVMWERQDLRHFCKFESGNTDIIYNEKSYAKAIFTAFFLLMTRAKCDFAANEPIPKFISQYCGIKLTIIEIRNHLGRNDFSKMDNDWIKFIKWPGFSEAFVARLKSGIAGTRLFNVIAQYPADNDGVSQEILTIYEAVRRVAVRGPFWTQHPFFYPEPLKGISILKNLNNLIVLCLSQKTLIKLSSIKATFGVLKMDERYNQFRSWATGFEELFKDEDKVNNFVDISNNENDSSRTFDINNMDDNNNNNQGNNNNNNNNNDGSNNSGQPSLII